MQWNQRLNSALKLAWNLQLATIARVGLNMQSIRKCSTEWHYLGKKSETLLSEKKYSGGQGIANEALHIY